MQERSAGVVVFRESPRAYLLLVKKRGALDFPKGKLERGETSAQAAVRETLEEAGVKVQLLPGFKRAIRYLYTRPGGEKVQKSVVFFLARVSRARKIKVSLEHKGHVWLSPQEALKRLRYKNAKWLVKEAQRFLKEG